MPQTKLSAHLAVKHLSNRILVSFACLAVVGITCFASQPASTQAAAPNLQVVSVAHGIVILNEEKGAVVFCSFSSLGAPPRPNGKCKSIGTVTKSAAGFIVTSNGINAFITNKTTGGIFQCTATLLNGLPVGACKEIGDVISV